MTPRTESDKTLGDDAEFFPPPAPGETWNDPHRLARSFADRHLRDGQRTLARWREDYYRWRGSWGKLPEADLDAAIARHCRAMFVGDLPRRRAEAEAAKTSGKGESSKPPKIYPVTGPVRANVRINLAGIVNVDDAGVEPPFWLPGGDLDLDPDDLVAAPNGLFDLDAIAAGRGPCAAPTPLLFTTSAVGFPIVMNPPRPELWLRSLDQWFDGDTDSVAALQEWCGYLLAGRTNLHKLLFLVGPRRSGKGSVLRVLVSLLGSANVASTTFAALGESFGMENLLGKRLALIPDARLSGRTDTATVVERLLSISGEDAQGVNRKNRSKLTTRLRCRFVLASNEIPRLPDAAGAVESRFHVLNMPNSWLGREDLHLGEKLAAELRGILRWAAEGWVRLRKQGMRFTQSAASESHHRELADLSSPIKAFVRQACETGPEFVTEIQVLFKAWQRWNQQRRREVPPAQTFGRDLKTAFPTVTVGQARNAGTRARVYRGIGLRPEGEWGDDPPPARNGTRANLTCAKEDGTEVKEEEVRNARVPARASVPGKVMEFDGLDLSPVFR